MNHKGKNLETYTSPEDALRDGDKMLADILLNKVFLQALNEQNTNKEFKREDERLGF